MSSIYGDDGAAGILVDSTGVPNATRTDITQINNHNGEISREVRLIYVIDCDNGMPIYFRYVAGNIIDVSCFSPMVSSAATTSESVPETEMSVNLIDGENATLGPTEIAIVAYAYDSTYPVCDHNDPTKGIYPHSTMRYIRTTRVYNYIEMRYDIRDWYE